MLNFKPNMLLFLFLFIFLIILVFDFPYLNKYEEDDFTIKRGENVLQIANNLKRSGRIKSKIVFVIQSLRGKNYTKIKAGTYSLKKEMSNKEIFNIIIKGENKVDYLTIVPGFSLKEISERIEAKGICAKQEFLDKYLNLSEENDKLLKEKFSFLEHKPSEAGLEGYLFPDTYEIDKEKGIDFLIDEILSNFDKKLTDDLRNEIQNQGKTIFEIITMASMLEKEVILYEDKEIISGILWKRLENGMLLEVDSVSLYFLGNENDKNLNLFYNTYRRSGLPITPIASPNMESIRAAIYPKSTDFWFYLSAKSGETIFSKNFNEHLINKFKYLDN